MKATIPMIARKGRASYLGERSRDHQDPGATSTWPAPPDPVRRRQRSLIERSTQSGSFRTSSPRSGRSWCGSSPPTCWSVGWSTGGSTRSSGCRPTRRRGRGGVRRHGGAGSGWSWSTTRRRPPSWPPATPRPPAGSGLPGHLRPGALRLLGGLYDAKLDHQPVLAITESQEIRLLGTSFQQELALETAFDDVADYNVRVNVPGADPGRGRHRDRPRPGQGDGLPHHLPAGPGGHRGRDQPLDADADRHPAHRPAVHGRSRGAAPADLRRAAEVLNQGAGWPCWSGRAGWRPGRSCWRWPTPWPVVESLPGKAAVPDDHPLTTGCIGVLGTRPSRRPWRATHLLLGTSFPWAANVPDPPGPGRPDRDRPGPLGGSGLPRSPCSGTPPRPSGRCCRCC